MAWTVTTGTVSGTAGSLITALDLELVTNRGWTKEFSGTNKAAYRNSALALARKYMRVVDDGTAPTSGARESLVQGYATMSTVDAGTGQFPTSGDAYIRKSSLADATARTYLAVGDDKTFYLFVLTGDTANQYLSHGFGDFYSYKPADTQACILFARPVNTTSSSEWSFFWQWNNSTYGANSANYIGGSIVGVPGETTLCKTVSGAVQIANYGAEAVNSHIPFPNVADGAIWVSPYQMLTSAGGSTVVDKVLRGKLRGIYYPMHNSVNFSDGDTFNGAGDLAAKSFRILKGVGFNGTSTYVGAVETTEPESST
jgi:hypothetical protein